MISGYIIVWFFVFALTILVIKNKGYKGIKKSGVFAGNQAISIGRKMPFALLSAAFIAQIVPIEELSHIVGPESGLLGITISALLGGLLPGGPMTSFPIALIFFAGGAGAPQIVALAIVIISGVTPNSCEANAEPVLPHPVITASKIKRILCLSQISLISFK